jgi:hypothetical protein
MSGRLRALVCLLVLPVASSAGRGATYPGRIGVGIGLHEFVDLVKQHYRWQAVSGNLTVDGRGWPTCDAKLVLDFRLVLEWGGVIDDPEAHRWDNTGTYKCAFKGQGAVAATGAAVSNASYDPGSNTTTFDFTISQRRAYADLSLTNTRRTPASATNTGFTDLRMIRPGYPADTKKVFTDRFLGCLNSANFAAIRFMDFTGTNNREPAYPGKTAWAGRKLPTDASQARMDPAGKLGGAAWEYVIEVGNLTGRDIWINVPLSADAGYVTQLATMIRDDLKADLNVYVESSNEVWNGIFNQ